MSRHTNIVNEEDLSKTLRSLLHKANISTFKQLAGHERLTLLKKIPKLTVRHLVALEKELKILNLSFVDDDTIIVDCDISQRKLFKLWEQGIRSYGDFNEMYRWEIIEVLGGKRSIVFKGIGVEGWIKKHNIIPLKPQGHLFYEFGLTEETTILLASSGIEIFEQLISLSDRELKLIVKSKSRIKEIDYVLWKNNYSRPCRPL